MSSLWAAFAFIAAIAVVAWFGLNEYAGWSSADRGSAPESVRLD